MCLLSSVLHQFIRSPNLSFYSFFQLPIFFFDDDICKQMDVCILKVEKHRPQNIL
jgi:hypothetical protein